MWALTRILATWIIYLTWIDQLMCACSEPRSTYDTISMDG